MKMRTAAQPAGDASTLRGVRVTVLAAFSDGNEVALGVWQGASTDEPAAAALAIQALWDDALAPLADETLAPLADAKHCRARCETEALDQLPPENTVIARYSWNWYRVSVTAQSETGATSDLGAWEGAANSRGDAERCALNALWDDRLDAASCSPVYTAEKMDQVPEKFSAKTPAPPVPPVPRERG